MGIVQHTINGRALYEAMKTTDGVEYLRGTWFNLDSNGKPTGGCAIGLMAINLGVQGNTSQNANANLYAQLRTIFVPSTSKWHREGYSPTENNVGDTIIYWNDAQALVPSGRIDPATGVQARNWDGEPEQKTVYTLPTFEEVHQMVYDVLEPHFVDHFTVDVWEFDAPDFTNFGTGPAVEDGGYAAY